MGNDLFPLSRALKLESCHDDIDFQTDFVMDFVKEANYGFDLDIGHLFHAWEHHKHQNILTYRDQSHVSKFTRKTTPQHHTPWWEAMDDSKEAFLAGYN